MGCKRLSTFSLGLALIQATACRIELDLPPYTQIQCSSDADCTDGYICLAETQRCIAIETRGQQGPTLVGGINVDPPVAALHSTVTIAFSVSAALALDPAVMLDLGDRQVPVGIVEAQSNREALSYVYSYSVNGSEPEALTPLQIALIGASGHPGSGESSVVFDFSAPTLDRAEVTPTLAAGGAQLVAAFELLDSTNVTVDEVVAVGGATNTTLTLAAVDCPTHAFANVFCHTLPAAAPFPADGPYEIWITAHDAAGNPTDPALVADRIVLDFTPPTVEQVSMLPSPAGPGDFVQVALSVSEAFADSPGPSITLVGPQTIVLGAPAREGLRLTYSHEVVAGENGDFAVWLSGLSDLAGNQVADQNLGTLVLDTQAPTIVASSYIQNKVNLLASDTLEVTFATNEPLRDAPEVRLRDISMSLLSGTGSGPFVYALAAPVGLSGTWPISVSMTDRAGNSSFATPGAASLDTALPNLANAVFSPEAARLGSVVLLTLTVDEDLGDTLDAGTALVFDQDPGFVWYGRSGLNYNFILSVNAGVTLPRYDLLQVNLTDLAGNSNTISGSPLASLTVDNTPPLVSACGTPLPTAPLAIGETLRISFLVEDPGVQQTPNVSIGGIKIGTADFVTPECTAGQDQSAYTIDYVVSGNEDELPQTVLVEVADAAGNLAAWAAGLVDFDFSGPDLIYTSAAPTPARLGTVIVYTLVATETLLNSPTVIATGNTTGHQITFAPVANTAYTFTHTVVGADAEDTYTVAVSGMRDQANNAQASPLAVTPEGFSIDKTKPLLSNLVSNRDRYSLNSPYNAVTATFDLDADVGSGALTVLFGAAQMACNAYQGPTNSHSCTINLDGSLDESPSLLSVVATDGAGNSASLNRPVVVDTEAPTIAAANVGYQASVSNPLSSVASAASNTDIVVNVVAGETLDPTYTPTLTLSNGAYTLSFAVVRFDAQGAVFKTTPADNGIVAGIGDGTFGDAQVGWRDSVGNTTATATLVGLAAEVKTLPPTLTILGANVSYLRLPTGYGAPRDLGGFVIPAGPYHALAPDDPFSPTTTLPRATFGLDGGTLPTRLRLWGDATMTLLLKTIDAYPTDPIWAWPREQLPDLTLPKLYVTGIDEAGNESAPVAIDDVVWITTSHPPASGAGAARSWLLQRTDGAREPEDGTVAGGATNLEAVDGQAALAVAAVGWQPIAPKSSAIMAAGGGFAFDFDHSRGRAMKFGAGSSELYEFNGSGWERKIPTTGEAPSGGFYTPGAWDAWRERWVLYSSGLYAWEWDGTRWYKKTDAGGSQISTRDNVALAYHAGRERVVLFGGWWEDQFYQVYYYDETWEWDGQQWSKLVGGLTPAGRAGHAMAYDPLRNVIVMYGGYDDGGPFTDGVWELSTAGWSKIASSNAPGGLSGHRMVWDASRDVVVLFSGAKTWEWNGASWTEATLSEPLPPTGAAGVAWDAQNRRLLASNGADVSARTEGQWRILHKEDLRTGAVAPLKSFHKLAYHADGYVLMIGGVDFTAGETYLWNGRGWNRPNATQPATNALYLFGLASSGPEIYLFGGADTVGARDALWVWDGADWYEVTKSGSWPGARSNLALTYDTRRGCLVLFGGLAGGSPQGDLWEYCAGVWTPRVFASGPSTRRDAAMAYDPDRGRVVLYGGSGMALPDTETKVWEWDGSAWFDATPASGPTPGAVGAHTMLWDSSRRRVVLQSNYTTLWEWDGSAWRSVTAQTAGPGTGFQAFAFDHGRQRIVTYGIQDSDTVWEWDRRIGGQPAVDFQVSFAEAGFARRDITDLIVVAHCGGLFSPFGAGDVGATLLGWSLLDGSGQMAAWKPLASNSAAVASTAPHLPDTSASVMSWDATTAAEALNLATETGRIALQCRPSGDNGTGAATVAMDHIEVQVRYQTP